MRLAKVAILFDHRQAERRWRFGINAFERYIAEILAHAGIPFEEVDGPVGLVNERYDMVIVACAEETEATAKILWSFAQKGGIVVSYAGIGCLARKLGCRSLPEFGPGYAELADGGGAMPDEMPPLRFLQAKPWIALPMATASVQAADSGVLRTQSPDGKRTGAALQRFAVGSGWIDRWSVNIPVTVVAMQQGTGPVLEDGIPAGDATADIDEGILKADDCCALDWELDRSRTETGTPFFAYPYADYWREAAIGHLVGRAAEAGLALPFVGQWPDEVKAVAMFSHDSDLNLDEQAIRTLEVLKENGLTSTWCMLEPGYSPEVYAEVKQAGHELAFHYNGLDMDNGVWSEEAFNRQLAWLKQAADIDEVVSNKNHYTRFEGWGELFAWCERAGIGVDQTRGPSKKGNVGFLFGTCQPYFPIAWADEGNRLYDVLEIGFLTQDIDHYALADFSVVPAFLTQVARVEGVAHFLSHQNHIHGQSDVAAAVGRIAEEARRRGFAFWTSRRIHDWQRARRTVRCAGFDAAGDPVVSGSPEAAGAVVWIPAVPDADGPSDNGQYTIKYGVSCLKKVVTTQAETGH